MKAKNKKPEWYIGYERCSEYCTNCKKVHYYLPKNICNALTIGLYKFNHPELQLVVDLGLEIVSTVLNVIGEEIKNGNKFQDGDVITFPFCDVPVLFRQVETDENILRVIIPDNECKYAEESKQFAFHLQHVPTSILYSMIKQPA